MEAVSGFFMVYPDVAFYLSPKAGLSRRCRSTLTESRGWALQSKMEPAGLSGPSNISCRVGVLLQINKQSIKSEAPASRMLFQLSIWLARRWTALCLGPVAAFGFSDVLSEKRATPYVNPCIHDCSFIYAIIHSSTHLFFPSLVFPFMHFFINHSHVLVFLHLHIHIFIPFANLHRNSYIHANAHAHIRKLLTGKRAHRANRQAQTNKEAKKPTMIQASKQAHNKQAHTQTRKQRSTEQHSTAQHSTAQHSTAQHSTAQHSTAQHSTAQHSTAQHTHVCIASM